MISMIACVDKNFGIGKDNKLLFNIKEDMQFFKETTINKTVVMGHNTYKSIGKFLPSRRNIVISRDVIGEPFIVMNVKQVLELSKKNSEEIFIIGGEKMYNEFLKYADNLYLTIVDNEKEADTFFPKFNQDNYDFKLLKAGISENFLEYKIIKYERK